MLFLEISDVSSLKEFISVPEIKWHSPVHRLDNEIDMCDVNGEICQGLEN